MYPVIELCRQALTDPARETELYIQMKKADGSIVDIEGAEHVRLGSFSIESQIWGNTFQLGSCIASDLSVTLDNVDGNWRVDELLGSTLFPFIRVKLNGQLIEEIPMGVFIVDRPGNPINVLTIKAADRLVLLDEPLKDAVNNLNTTNANLVHDICNYCKVPVSASTYQALNMGHRISLDEIPNNMTCRDGISEIALMAGGFVRMNRLGELEIISLDTSNQLANSETWGQQRLNKNTWGALKAAGRRWVDLNRLTNRTTYGKIKQDRVTWGSLKRRGIPWKLIRNFDIDSEDLKKAWLILPNARYDLSQDTEPLTITGMSYKSKAWGTADYVLEIKNIQLLKDEDAESILAPVWQRINGLNYTPFNCNYIGNPAIDTGDLVWHIGRNGLSLVSFVGKHTFRHNAKSKLSSGGKSKQELNYKTQNERRLVELSAQTKQVKSDLTDYQQSTAQMADMLTQALGVYGPTAVRQENGANYYYLHDKPTLAESQTVWRFDGQWLAISDDGGRTWSGGISAQSKLVMRVIDAVKISAEQIKAGAITTEMINVSECYSDGDTLTDFVTNIAAGRIELKYKDAHYNYYGEISVLPSSNYFIQSGKVYEEKRYNVRAGRNFGFRHFFIYFSGDGKNIKLALRRHNYKGYDDVEGGQLRISAKIIPKSNEAGTALIDSQSYNVDYLYRWLCTYFDESNAFVAFSIVVRLPSVENPDYARPHLFTLEEEIWLRKMLEEAFYQFDFKNVKLLKDLELNINQDFTQVIVWKRISDNRKIPVNSLSSQGAVITAVNNRFDLSEFRQFVDDALSSKSPVTADYFDGTSGPLPSINQIPQLIKSMNKQLNPNFYIDKEGNLNAINAQIQGAISSKQTDFGMRMDGKQLEFNYLHMPIGTLEMFSNIEGDANAQNVRLVGYGLTTVGIGYTSTIHDTKQNWVFKTKSGTSDCYGEWTFRDGLIFKFDNGLVSLEHQFKNVISKLNSVINTLNAHSRRIETLEKRPAVTQPVITYTPKPQEPQGNLTGNIEHRSLDIYQEFYRAGGMRMECQGKVTWSYLKNGKWKNCRDPALWWRPGQPFP